MANQPRTPRRQDVAVVTYRTSVEDAVRIAAADASRTVDEKIGATGEAFWADGEELGHLTALVKHVLSWSEKRDPVRILPHVRIDSRSYLAAGSADATFVASLSKALGVDFGSRPAARERLGNVFARYAQAAVDALEAEAAPDAEPIVDAPKGPSRHLG